MKYENTTAVSEGLTQENYMDTIKQTPAYGGMPCRKKIDWLYQEAIAMGATLPDGVSVYERENVARLMNDELIRPDFKSDNLVEVDALDDILAA